MMDYLISSEKNQSQLSVAAVDENVVFKKKKKIQIL